jgi:flagellar basal body-associated protein FliL
MVLVVVMAPVIINIFFWMQAQLAHQVDTPQQQQTGSAAPLDLSSSSPKNTFNLEGSAQAWLSSLFVNLGYRE